PETNIAAPVCCSGGSALLAARPVQCGGKLALEPGLQRAGLSRGANDKISERTAIQYVGAPRRLRGPRVRDPLLRLELDPGQEQVLREHVDHLAGRVVLQP